MSARQPSRDDRGSAENAPLGSLTQSESLTCKACDSRRVTRLHLSLPEGRVEFTSCRECGTRTWVGGERELGVDEVLNLASRR